MSIAPYSGFITAEGFYSKGVAPKIVISTTTIFIHNHSRYSAEFLTCEIVGCMNITVTLLQKNSPLNFGAKCQVADMIERDLRRILIATKKEDAAIGLIRLKLQEFHNSKLAWQTFIRRMSIRTNAQALSQQQIDPSEQTIRPSEELFEESVESQQERIKIQNLLNS